ncbi:MAG: tetratricopeptide repeat protein [Candidatus Competibacteraceae bacterium]|nr:tetratricopeptide repeat protein [Candidatus Competibacteraceae bacterium]
MMRSVLLACVAALLFACAASPPPTSQLRSQALAAAEAGGKHLAGRHFAAAERAFGQAAQIYGAIDDPTAQAAALRNQAEAFRRAGDLDAATTGFERALIIDRREQNTVGQARAFAGLARCSSGRGDIDHAIQQSEQALGLASDSAALHASLQIDLAVYLLVRGYANDQKRIIELLTLATERALNQGEPRTVAAAQLHLGRAQLFFGSLELAEEPLRSALSVFRALDDPEGIARTHEELGRLLNALNQPDAAQRHFKQARRGYEFLGDEAALAQLDELIVEERD